MVEGGRTGRGRSAAGVGTRAAGRGARECGVASVFGADDGSDGGTGRCGGERVHVCVSVQLAVVWDSAFGGGAERGDVHGVSDSCGRVHVRSFAFAGTRRAHTAAVSLD